MPKTDISELFFQEFYWGNLIGGEEESLELIKKELIWDRIGFHFFKLGLDDCFGTSFDLLLFR